jgi:hypothetical protein
VQLGQHSLEPGWRVGCRCGLGKELGGLASVPLADGVRDKGTQLRTRPLTLPAGTAVRQIALDCLLPGVSRGWRAVGGLFEAQQRPGFQGRRRGREGLFNRRYWLPGRHHTVAVSSGKRRGYYALPFMHRLQGDTNIRGLVVEGNCPSGRPMASG